jgi:hypothetical protein
MAISGSRPEVVPGYPEQALLGTWRLVSWQAHGADGTVTYPLGEHAVGYLVYTADGRMFAQLMRPGRPGFASGDMLRGTAAENAAAVGGYVAYSGTFEVRDGAVFHRVDLSLFPNWIGGEQRRSIAWDGDRLILSSPPVLVAGRALVHRIVWERTSPTVKS